MAQRLFVVFGVMRGIKNGRVLESVVIAFIRFSVQFVVIDKIKITEAEPAENY